jgi:hypothetical protein
MKGKNNHKKIATKKPAVLAAGFFVFLDPAVKPQDDDIVY